MPAVAGAEPHKGWRLWRRHRLLLSETIRTPAPVPPREESAKNLEIEALRCFAVVIVVIGHSHNLLSWHDGLMNTAIGLWTGVDVFLGISGFVITKAFAAQIRSAFERGAWLQASANFLARRALRLLPASLFWIFVVYLASCLCNRSGAFGSPAQNLQDAVAIVLSISNIYFAMCTVGSLSGCGPNGIYWTVSLEQQFYVLFPALILLKRSLLLGLFCVVILFFAFVHRNVWVWYDRVDPIAVGTALALVSETAAYRNLEPTFLGRRALNWIAAAALLGFLLFGTAVMAWHGLFAAAPATVTATVGVILFLVSFNRGYLFKDGRFTRTLAYVGERSYSVYLTHNLSMFMATETFFRLAPVGTKFGPLWDAPLVSVAILYLAALTEFSYRIIEVPLRAYGKRITLFRSNSLSKPIVTK